MQHHFSVAVKAVVLRGNCVLVLRRSQQEMQGSYINKHQKWDFPGGGLHFFEHTKEGLLREIYEETGIRVQIGMPLSVRDVIRHPVHLCIVTYLAEWREGKVCLSKEHDGFYWLHREEIPKSTLPQWMKRMIEKAFVQREYNKT